jgi:hypothetical protein
MEEARIKPAPYRRYRSKAEHADENRFPKRQNIAVAVDHDNRIGPCRGVYRSCEEHVPQHQDLRQYVNPHRIAEELIARDADEGAAEMASEQGARLCRGSTCKTEKEDRGTPERGEEKRRGRGGG